MKSVSSIYKEIFHQLIAAPGQSRPAKAVEAFGWLILLEGSAVILFPRFAATVLDLPELGQQAENYFRLVGLLVSGLGMLYVASGRLNAEEFVFASLLDRPLVPLAMAILWYLKIIPWPLALVFSIQDFGSFLWTLCTWRSEHGARQP
ncbi:MAG: hypothetical protein ACM3TN_24225 [Alphaproteobacteria bacterium]